MGQSRLRFVFRGAGIYIRRNCGCGYDRGSFSDRAVGTVLAAEDEKGCAEDIKRRIKEGYI